MTLKYKSWEDITVSRYMDIAAIEGGTSEDSIIDGSIDTLAYLCGATREEVEQLPIDEFTALMAEAQWIKTIEERVIPEDIIINGKRYNLITDMSTFIVSQYIAWNMLTTDPLHNLSKLLGCILVPHGKSYDNGYKVADVVKDIDEHMQFLDALAILRFFDHAQRASFANTLRKVKKVARMKMLTTRDKALREQMRKELNTLSAISRYHGWN